MTPRISRSLKSQSGFTLIESLVAIVIMAMGLIGIALMQAQGLRFSDGAYSRTQASMLANDIIDRMRVHGDSAIAEHAELRKLGVAADETTDQIDDYIESFIVASEQIEAESGLCVYGDNVDPGELILVEVACWKDAVAEQLNGKAVIEGINATSISVVISWMDRSGTKADIDKDSEQRSLTIVSEFGNLTW